MSNLWVHLLFSLSYLAFSYALLQPSSRISHTSNSRIWSTINGDSAGATSPSYNNEEVLSTTPKKNDESIDRSLRFSGISRLYSSPNDLDNGSRETILKRLQYSQVVIFGIGGVGSWIAESLGRSGVGSLVLVDLDDICVSNINRQLHSLSHNVGQSKVEEMKKRLLDINPEINVQTVWDFVNEENVDSIFDSVLRSEGTQKSKNVICIDAIDGSLDKISIINSCVKRQIPIITCGGAAGRTDPTLVRCEDLTKAIQDRLLSTCRTKLRKDYGYSAGSKSNKKRGPRKWNILSVYSEEQIELPDFTDENSSSLRQCDGALGTASFVTATYGMVAASRAVEMIASDKYLVPKKLGIGFRKQHNNTSITTETNK